MHNSLFSIFINP